MGDVQLLAFRGAPHEVGLFDVGTGRAELNRTSTILLSSSVCDLRGLASLSFLSHDPVPAPSS